MKRLTLGLIAWCCLGVASTWAITKAELDDRVRKLAAKFDELQQKSEKRIPAETLAKAHGIILLDRTKAGFIFAYQGGSGVALVRDPNSKEWSPAAFVAASEASLGFQVGGQQSFIVLLLMTTNATAALTKSTFEFGGEARGTAGDQSEGVEGSVKSHEQPVLFFSDSKGLYGGVSVKGGAITPDGDANLAYYGQYRSMKDILFDRKVKAGETAVELAKKFNVPSNSTKK
ncbi:MAG TPA: lipid-binding SYLF domain-containing protein [Verrucomicrobiae bacterium]